MMSRSTPRASQQESVTSGGDLERLRLGLLDFLGGLERSVLCGERRGVQARRAFRGVLQVIYSGIAAHLAGVQGHRETDLPLFPRNVREHDGLNVELGEAGRALLDSIAAQMRDIGDWGRLLQQLFEPVIAFQPRWTNGRLKLARRTRRNRRAAGSFYTPDWIVRLVLDWTLDQRSNTVSTQEPQKPQVLYDPACGSGRFLVSALERLAAQGGNPQQIRGRDKDPLAADLCSTALALGQLETTGDLPGQPLIESGDSLLADTLPSASPNLDCGPLTVVGNPPFVNAIGRQIPPALTAKYKQRHPLIRGAADMAAYFLAHAAGLAGPGGRVGLVLPRAILNSRSAEKLRAELPHELRPVRIWAPDEPFAFSGAAVYFCVVVLGQATDCLFSVAPRGEPDSFSSGSIESANWWRELCRICYGDRGRAEVASTRLADAFDVRAGLTAGEAYELREYVGEARSGAGKKLLTTGLIDPGRALWGERLCRFLKADYRHPRVSIAASANPRLARRLAHAGRPKLIVAGLARRIEACADLQGEYLGSVSTWVITHARDDRDMLRALLEELSTPRSAELVHRELGANALGGGNTTITKSFLQDYPLHGPAASWH